MKSICTKQLHESTELKSSTKNTIHNKFKFLWLYKRWMTSAWRRKATISVKFYAKVSGMLLKSALDHLEFHVFWVYPFRCWRDPMFSPTGSVAWVSEAWIIKIEVRLSGGGQGFFEFEISEALRMLVEICRNGVQPRGLSVSIPKRVA